jgi:hypothetical protein
VVVPTVSESKVGEVFFGWIHELKSQTVTEMANTLPRRVKCLQGGSSQGGRAKRLQGGSSQGGSKILLVTVPVGRLGVGVAERNGTCVVVSMLDQSENALIKPHDVILAVNNVALSKDHGAFAREFSSQGTRRLTALRRVSFHVPDGFDSGLDDLAGDNDKGEENC